MYCIYAYILNGPPCGPLPAFDVTYESIDELVSACQAHALDNGYKLVIHSKKTFISKPQWSCFTMRPWSRVQQEQTSCLNPLLRQKNYVTTQTHMCRCPVLTNTSWPLKTRWEVWITKQCKDAQDINHQQHNHPPQHCYYLFRFLSNRVVKAPIRRKSSSCGTRG